MVCRVCLKLSEEVLNIFDAKRKENIAHIIQQHFWFLPMPNDSVSTVICSDCWNKISDFHEFYMTVQQAQGTLQSTALIEMSKVDSEDKGPAEQMEFEITIKEEFVENVWQVTPEEVLADNLATNNPLYEPEVLHCRTAAQPAEVNVYDMIKSMSTVESNPDGSSNEDEYQEPKRKINDVVPSTSHMTRRKRGRPSLRTEEKVANTLHEKSKKSQQNEKLINKYIPMDCKLCNFYGKDFGEIQTHFRKEHFGVRPFVKCCRQKLQDLGSLFHHALKHEDPESIIAEEVEAKSNAELLLIMRERLRKHSNPLELPNSKFVHLFGMSKEAFQHVLEELVSKVNTYRSTAVPLDLKLATTLRILVEGGHQHVATDDFKLGLAQPTVSKVFKEILNALETHVCPKWLKLDMTDEEKAEAKLYFFEKTCFPGVIGCVDGSHIKILTPGKDEQQTYHNKKGFYSLNAMIVCDHKMQIRFLDASQPGSKDDAFVWHSSDLRTSLKNQFDEGETNTWLLGDAGYPLEPYLITPFRSTQEGTPESAFNAKHASARTIIDRTIAAFKRRFRCVDGSRQLHYTPQKAIQITKVCAALHNICMHYNPANSVTEEPVAPIESYTGKADNTDDNDIADDAVAVDIRNQIMNEINF